MADAQVNPYFLALLREYEMLGMLGLGKLADPASGESSLDLARTQFAIGILEMLEKKTEGNLISQEKQELQRVLTTLRLNFVEEAQKQGKETAESEKGAGESDGEAPAESAEESPSGKPPATEEQAEEVAEKETEKETEE